MNRKIKILIIAILVIIAAVGWGYHQTQRVFSDKSEVQNPYFPETRERQSTEEIEVCNSLRTQVLMTKPFNYSNWSEDDRLKFKELLNHLGTDKQYQTESQILPALSENPKEAYDIIASCRFPVDEIVADYPTVVE